MEDICWYVSEISHENIMPSLDPFGLLKIIKHPPASWRSLTIYAEKVMFSGEHHFPLHPLQDAWPS